jgi:hypothetical protein
MQKQTQTATLMEAAQADRKILFFFAHPVVTRASWNHCAEKAITLRVVKHLYQVSLLPETSETRTGSNVGQ